MRRADALVLEIGGEVGALVVYADATFDGKELDLVPVGSPRSHHLHNVVRRRTTASGDVAFAAVFPQVLEGRYTLWGGAGASPLAEAAVAGGRVSEAHIERLEPDEAPFSQGSPGEDK